MAGSQGMMRSKFGASEMRLNMLDTFVPLEYPVTVYRDVWDARQVRVVKCLFKEFVNKLLVVEIQGG